MGMFLACLGGGLVGVFCVIIGAPWYAAAVLTVAIAVIAINLRRN